MATREKDTYLNKEGLEYYHRKITSEFATKDELEEGLELKQDILTEENAGDGISIATDSSGNVIITNTQTSAEWGNITGDITDQTDLVEYIDENGGQISSISVNGVEQEIDSSKNVDITINDSTITLQQNGETTATFSTDQSSDQTIDLGRSGDWYKLYAMPFNSSGTIEYTSESNISYYKICTTSSSPYTYLSGDELMDIINNHNCYIIVRGWYLLYRKEFDFNRYDDADGVGGKVYSGTAATTYYLTAEFTNQNNDRLTVVLIDNYAYTEEATATISSELIAGTGITVTSASNSKYKTIAVDDTVVALQTDLDDKQDALTAGNGITIDDDNEISITDWVILNCGVGASSSSEDDDDDDSEGGGSSGGNTYTYEDGVLIVT